MEARTLIDAGIISIVAAAALAGGEVIQVPDGRAGIVAGLKAAAAGDTVGVHTQGQFVVAKTAGIVILDGGRVYWDRSASTASYKADPGTGDFYLGVAVGDAASADTEVTVDLNVQQRNQIELGRGIWDTAIVKTAGTPAATKDAGGSAVTLAFSATAEAQKVDILSRQGVPVGTPFVAEFRMAVYDIGDEGSVDINVGVANATHATDADEITESVFIHLDGTALDIKAESDDGTTEVNATDTTVNAVDDTYFEVWIDARVQTDIQIYINGVNVLPDSVFKLNAAAGPMKALAHIEKGANDTPGDVRIELLQIRTTDVP